jgi:hypothetical protein
MVPETHALVNSIHNLIKLFQGLSWMVFFSAMNVKTATIGELEGNLEPEGEGRISLCRLCAEQYGNSWCFLTLSHRVRHPWDSLSRYFPHLWEQLDTVFKESGTRLWLKRGVTSVFLNFFVLLHVSVSTIGFQKATAWSYNFGIM